MGRRIVFILGLVLMAGLTDSRSIAAGRTFVVNRTFDDSDPDVFDNVCDVDLDTPEVHECTLRAAIQQANFDSAQDTITFNLNPGGPSRIQPVANMPLITHPVIILGSSQPGYSGTPIIELDGSNTPTSPGSSAIGLYITAGNSVVQGLVINRYDDGILLGGQGNNQIIGNYFGTDVAGTADLGNRVNGIEIRDGSGANQIGGAAPGQRNVISGNGGAGIYIHGVSPGNTIQGNFIGTQANGVSGLGNDNGGVLIDGVPGTTIGAATGTTPGGPCTGACNLISANRNNGIGILGANTTGTTVKGNFIGTDVNGAEALGNTINGIVFNGARDILIGGTTAAERNVISGNGGSGIVIVQGSSGIDVRGNFIGTKANGSEARGNAFSGVEIQSASGNTIGGLTEGERNIISGNQASGVQISGEGATLNKVQGNYIGTRADGAGPLGNAFAGVLIAGIQDNTIGGAVAGARNVISANGQSGVVLQSGASKNQVLGNFIGTQANGSAALGNALSGVAIQDSPENTIGAAAGTTPGGPCTGACNVISANQRNGIHIDGATASRNQVQGNFIGADKDGATALGNTFSGVVINGAPENTIGGPTTAERNVISANMGTGVYILGVTASKNQVLGNFIGTQANGRAALGNAQSGVAIQDAPGNTVGGATGTTPGGPCTGACNVISANQRNGIHIDGATASKNQVQGNFIGAQVSGGAGLGNTFSGVLINGSPENTIGGAAEGQRNVISANQRNGVHIDGTTASKNQVLGNFIGTQTNGSVALGNTVSGVLINGAPENTIGAATGTTPGGLCTGACNVISANKAGVYILGTTASKNQVLGNFIGTQVNGGAALGNTFSGVEIQDAPENTIGGTTAAERNVISANLDTGVYIHGATSSKNQVLGNFIGTQANGSVPLGNIFDGVLVDGAPETMIGGTTEGQRNIISANGQNGIVLRNGASKSQVLGNFIGTQANGNVALGNTVSGVLINGAPENTIGAAAGTTPGGPCTGACNVISANKAGVYILGATASKNQVLGNFIGTQVNGGAGLGNTFSGVEINDAPENTIGGLTAAERNVISANLGTGVYIHGATASKNQVLGNFIGAQASGSAALGNALSGVYIGDAPGNVIGAAAGTTPGGSCTGACNVISANQRNGIHIDGATASKNQVLGNFIGADKDGTTGLGNTFSGVVINGAPENTIGGPTAAERNVISANLGTGVYILGAAASKNQVLGNFIGAQANGSVALGNVLSGVAIQDAPGNTVGGATGTTPGGSCTGACNVISANQNNGVYILGAAANTNQVLGNFIGTQVNGSAALGNTQSGVIVDGAPNNTMRDNLISANQHGVSLLNAGATGNRLEFNQIGTNADGSAALGNTSAGVVIDNAPGNNVGGTQDRTANVISGNGGIGVSISGVSAQGNQVQGNLIGPPLRGSANLGNGAHGVFIANSASDNIIGGTAAGALNTIVSNGGDGVEIASGTGNGIYRNIIDANAGLGIDLAPNGVTGNDPTDGDAGPNNLQNFPVVGSISANRRTIGGGLNSVPGTSFLVELFANATCDPSGFGEGRTYLGSTTATTNGSGSASFTLTLTAPVPRGQAITATASGPGNNTSEFSRCFVGGPLIETITPSSAPQASRDLELTIKGAHFQPGTIVSFQPADGIEVVPPGPPNFGFVSPTELRVRINVAADAPLSERNLFVTNPSGETSNPAGFIVTAPAMRVPEINGFQVSLFAPIAAPRGIAVDADGNVFVVGRDSGTISKITPAGIVSPFAQLGSDFEGWNGPAIDASGNLFVSHYTGNNVRKITPSGVVSIFATGISSPAGLVTDADGNVYVSSYHGGQVFKITPEGSVSEYATGLSGPDALAIYNPPAGASDAWQAPSGPRPFAVRGELYIGARGSHRIYRIPAGGGARTLFAQLDDAPYALAFDRAGRLIAGLGSTTGGGRLVQVGTNGVVTPLGTGLSFPLGLAFAGTGELYIVDFIDNLVYRATPVTQGVRVYLPLIRTTAR